jgi:hypothetical protein
LFFALGLHPIISRVERETTLRLHVWYFDDGRIDGIIPEVKKAWDILVSDLPSVGLRLKLVKCKLAFSEVYEERRGEPVPEDAMDIDEGGPPPPLIADTFPIDMERVMRSERHPSERGYVTMGTPVGSREFIDGFFSIKLESLRALHRRIAKLRSLHSQLWILRTCASVCKIMFWMRIMDPELMLPLARCL